ncbi:MAG TPA: class I SAM-dependent methyltransferase [Opitutaceae bacterium]
MTQAQPIPLPHRTEGCAMLRGDGVEIGAFDCPAPLPATCSVRYFDALSREEAGRRFPELDVSRLVEPDILGDLDLDGLAAFGGRSLDFVVCNHVLEHVANPVRVVGELFRVLKPGGHAVIAIPDKDYTFDRAREPTGWEHLLSDHRQGVVENDDSHYLDFLRKVAPHVFEEPGRNIAHEIERARARREHAHVWTTATFREFMGQALRLLKVRADPVFERTGMETQIEYFSVWRKRRSWLPWKTRT